MTSTIKQNLTPTDDVAQGMAGLELFFGLADFWGLSKADQLTLLGQSSRATLATWQKRVENNDSIRLSADTLERLSLIAGIQKGVELLFPKSRWADYLRAPNQAFGGMSLLEVMLTGQVVSLYKARRHLDASRGSDFG